MNEPLTPAEQVSLQKTILRIHEQGWGIAFGLVFGLGLFIATTFLVLKGGTDVGAHLSLLRLYLPGYSVSFLGSLVGLVYGFVIGYGIGRMIASAYNRLTAGM